MKQGRLKIAVVTTSKYFMPRVLGPFCERYPGIDVAMEVINRDRLLERLASNEDDLYIMGVPPNDLDIDSEPLIANPLVVVAPASHRLAKRGRIRFSELANQVFLMREKGSGTRIAIERLFAEKQTPLQVKMELGSNEAIKQAVAGGLGLAGLVTVVFVARGRSPLRLVLMAVFSVLSVGGALLVRASDATLPELPSRFPRAGPERAAPGRGRTTADRRGGRGARLCGLFGAGDAREPVTVLWHHRGTARGRTARPVRGRDGGRKADADRGRAAADPHPYPCSYRSQGRR